MGKITIMDECLVPDRWVRIRYSGPDPWGVAEFITNNIRKFFHVSASGTNNSRINWDITGDPITFYSVWWVKKSFSRFTYMRVLMKLIGSKGKKKNVGEFALRMRGQLFTEFKGWGIFLKPVWLMYSYLFYNRARRAFIERCRNYVLNFRNEIKKHFNIEATEIPTARGSYG